MADTIISSKYPPHIDVTCAPLAYGDRALPRVNRELKDDTLITRQRAVVSLCAYLHDPEHIASAIREGIVQTLCDLLYDEDVTVRQKSTKCLYVIAGHSIGRQNLLQCGILTPLSYLFDDPEDAVRWNAHHTVKVLSEVPFGAEGIGEAKLVPGLVEKLISELDVIKEVILDTLHFCMMVEPKPALESGAMQVFTNLLYHKDWKIRANAARDIMDLSVPLEGKYKAVEVKCVQKLVSLLDDDNCDVRANCAGAIMVIAITTKGKYTALEASAINPLIALVDDDVSEVRLNALKALTCLSEAPEGRNILLNHVEKISNCSMDAIPAVAAAATTAVRVITWKP